MDIAASGKEGAVNSVDLLPIVESKASKSTKSTKVAKEEVVDTSNYIVLKSLK